MSVNPSFQDKITARSDVRMWHMMDETTTKEARLEMYRQQVAALEQRVRDLEANLFAATATVVDLEAKLRQVEGERDEARQERDQLRAKKDQAYLERNQVVAALAKCFPSGVAKTAIEGWDEEWHGCVYIDLPTGQVSWHYHNSHAHFFAGLPPYKKPWDGHTTEQKYDRVSRLDMQDHATLRARVGRLEEALQASRIGLDDWLNQYASELCDEERVKEVRERIADNGGTLAYIAQLQDQNRRALQGKEEHGTKSND